jgi:predicted nucleic acid-binding protein
MVLVDTSVWIRFFAGREPYFSEMNRLLARDQVAGHQLVYGELLIGDRGGRSKFLSTFEWMQQAEMVPHDEVVELVGRRDLIGRGLGWIDAHLLASALAGRLQLWTADRLFADAAVDLAVDYTLRDS